MHTRTTWCSGREAAGDANFQGYGRFLTGSTGEYLIRTIKPLPYTLYGIARAPHVHLAVSLNGRRVLTTQVLVQGHPHNAADGVLQGLAPRGVSSGARRLRPGIGRALR
jgi:protocatechuate 3,4-dioxygenase, beta subunit